MRNRKYTYNLAKGCALIEETLALLAICEESTTKESLAKYVHENNYLSRCTEKRSMDIVKQVFYPRYMEQNPSIPCWLKAIRNKGVMLPQFKQILMVYCARANAIMYDYIINEFNELRASDAVSISKESISKYVDNIVVTGQAEWGDSIKKRNASYIKSVLTEFDMIKRNGEILPYEISSITMLYLMHELHFAGLSDVAIWNHEDWQLFGLDRYQLLDRIMEQNIKGGYIAQCTGDLMTISWNYNSMEEFINGTL